MDLCWTWRTRWWCTTTIGAQNPSSLRLWAPRAICEIEWAHMEKLNFRHRRKCSVVTTQPCHGCEYLDARPMFIGLRKFMKENLTLVCKKTFIGYSEGNSYRLLFYMSQKLIIFQDVTFHETCTPSDPTPSSAAVFVEIQLDGIKPEYVDTKPENDHLVIDRAHSSN